MNKEEIGAEEMEGFTLYFYYSFDDFFGINEVEDDLYITTERVDGSSVKLNNFGISDKRYSTYWATPKPSQDMEEFRIMCENVKSFLRNELNAYVLHVEAYKHGILLGTACMGGYLSSCEPTIGEFKVYSLHTEALADAKISLKKLIED